MKARELFNLRKAKVQDLTGRINAIMSNNMYSDQYKSQETAKLKGELTAARREMDAKIREDIETNRKHLTKLYYTKQEMDTAGEVRALRQFLVNEKLAKDLVAMYQPKEPGQGLTPDRQVLRLWHDARFHVANGTPEAAAYVDALKQLAGIDNRDWQELNDQHITSQQTPEQAQINTQIEELNTLEQAHEVETLKERYHESPTSPDRLQVKMQLHRLGVNV